MINKKRQFFRKNRKGELTTKQLVTIIILITSFVIVLFLFFRLNLGETSNKEICRNSVVLRGQSSITYGPLDCRTNYLCISGGGDCGTITATATENVNAEKEDEIMKVLAEEMASCWWQFGEGKIRYTGGGTSTSVDCSICSIVEFDEQLKDTSISYQDFYDYLGKTEKEGSQSYLNYLYGVNDVNFLEIQQHFSIVDLNSDFLHGSERYSIITGIDNNLVDIYEDDEWLKVYLIPTSETSLTQCDDFLTKA